MTGAQGGVALGPGREFDAIRRMLALWGPAASDVGDDAAVLSVPAGELLCVSTDASVEGVHFRRGWLTPREIGYRATVAALSDLAAMAARPLGVLVAVVLPERWRGELDALAEGVGEAALATGAPIVGGDTSAGAELSLTVTVLGAARVPLRRSGARPGDVVYVTGTFGGPFAALAAFLEGREPDPAHRGRFARPAARVGEARWLAERGARAAVDVSDGLAADLAHVAAASGVRIVVDLDRVPRVAAVSAADAARSGEEYELALTAPAGLDARAFAERFGVPLTAVGTVEHVGAGAAGEIEARVGGRRVDLPAGHDHLSSQWAP